MHFSRLSFAEQVSLLLLLGVKAQAQGASCTYDLTGVTGTCMSVDDCAASGQFSTPGLCAGPADIQCCTDTLGFPDDVPSTGDVSAFGLSFIESFEGWSSNFYLDQAGYKTIGYGHKCEDAACGGITEPLSRADGDDLLRQDAARFVACIINDVTADLNQNQFDALVDFAFNLGCVPLSNVATNLNADDFSGATDRMQLYNKVNVGGTLVVSPVLAKRRAIEVNLFNS